MRDLEKYGHDYASQPYERFQVAFRKRVIRQVLDRHPHGRILEIGCGLVPLFLDVVDFVRLVVLEPAPLFHARAVALRESSPVRDRVEIMQDTLEAAASRLAVEDFDFIVLSSLLHEVPKPEEFLRAIQPLAGLQTVVHVNVPNAHSFHRLLAFEAGLISDPRQASASNLKFQQATVFDLGLLTTLAERCGFTVFESGSYAMKPFTHRQMEDMIQAKILSEQVVDGLFEMEKYFPGYGSEIFVNLRKAAG